jgi:ribosomal protein L44E
MPNPRERDTRTPDKLTLRDLVEQRIGLYFECANCRRLSPVDLLDLVAKFGPDSRVEPIRFKAKCSTCGKRRAKPLYRYPLRKGLDEWWPHPPGAGR